MYWKAAWETDLHRPMEQTKDMAPCRPPPMATTEHHNPGAHTRKSPKYRSISGRKVKGENGGWKLVITSISFSLACPNQCYTEDSRPRIQWMMDKILTMELERHPNPELNSDERGHISVDEFCWGGGVGGGGQVPYPKPGVGKDSAVNSQKVWRFWVFPDKRQNWSHHIGTYIARENKCSQISEWQNWK